MVKSSKYVVLGIDVGGTNTVYGFIDEFGYVQHCEEIPTKGTLAISNLITRLDSKINKFFEKRSYLKLIGIGIGAPNGNHMTGFIENPPNLSWESVDIVNIFKKKYNVEVKLTNDANAAALGEKYFGLAKKMNDFVLITLGTGLGSGIFSGGKLVYGSDGFAGEMGHMVIREGGRECNCGNFGCLEAYVSATGISTTIRKLVEKNPNDQFLQKAISNNKINGELLDYEYDRGNKYALYIYQYTGKKLGYGLAQVASILSPEAFIFYGGFSNAGHRLLIPAKKSMEMTSLRNQTKKINLLQSVLPSGQAGILGAGSLLSFFSSKNL